MGVSGLTKLLDFKILLTDAHECGMQCGWELVCPDTVCMCAEAYNATRTIAMMVSGPDGSRVAQ
jgi:hypothetical protein